MSDLRNPASGEQRDSRSRDNNASDLLNLVFRFRHLLHILVLGGAFAISWATRHSGGMQRVWLTLPEAVSAHLKISLGSAITALTTIAMLLAVAAAALRTWGTAYLGREVVFGSNLNEGQIITSGPYRYLRNPLYVGTMLHTLALTVLMTWVGAIFAIAAMAALQLALIAAEKRYYEKQLGSPYFPENRRVPTQSPTPNPDIRPRWAQALAGEIYMWGVAVSFAAFGFSYNALLVWQGVLVSFGLSIVVRGLTKKQSPRSV